MKNIIFCSLSLFIAVSCSPRLSPLTESLKAENQWSERELSKIQFYLSEDVILSRQKNSGSTEIEGGRVRVENGKNIQEIVFRRGTPGVVLFTREDKNLAIGFDPSDDSKYLMFGPNPKQRGKFTLLAKDWKRYSGKVNYAGLTWQVSASNADVNLLLNLKKKRNTEKRVRQESGRRL